MTKNKWNEAGVEPKLSDMLNDPIFKLVMQRDNLEKEDVLHVMNQAKAKMEYRAAC
jgi:hypothetical protein